MVACHLSRWLLCNLPLVQFIATAKCAFFSAILMPLCFRKHIWLLLLSPPPTLAMTFNKVECRIYALHETADGKTQLVLIQHKLPFSCVCVNEAWIVSSLLKAQCFIAVLLNNFFLNQMKFRGSFYLTLVCP